MNSDGCISFYLAEGKIRGHFCKINCSIKNALENHLYPKKIQQMLAEMVVISQCFIANLKNDCRGTLQLNGTKQIKTVVVDTYSSGTFRCCATFDDNNLKVFSNLEKLDFCELIGKDGKFIFTVEFEKQRYQTIIPFECMTLEKCFQYYFDQSEQIPTKMLCQSNAVGADVQAAALVLQRLPMDAAEFDDCNEIWDSVKLFLETIKANEMLLTKKSMIEFVKLIFNEFNPIVSRETSINFECSCSKEKFLKTMNAMQIVEKGLTVSCHFCGKEYYIE